jgi:hypothetical protein
VAQATGTPACHRINTAHAKGFHAWGIVKSANQERRYFLAFGPISTKAADCHLHMPVSGSRFVRSTRAVGTDARTQIAKLTISAGILIIPGGPRTTMMSNIASP